MNRLAIAIIQSCLISFSAHAERKQLKTGEWLADSQYGTLTPFGGERELTLTVKFEAFASGVLREQSLQELVTRHLLPTAMRVATQRLCCLKNASDFR